MILPLFVIAWILGLSTFSQSYLPGTIYFGQYSLIKYQAGNLPVILSAPHGEHESPTTITDRNGGYNTRRFDSQTVGTIDAVQIEHNWDVRANPAIRARLADSFAQIFSIFWNYIISPIFSSYSCNYFTGTKEYTKKKVTGNPNPFTTHIELKEVSNNSTFSLLSQEGMLVMRGTLTDNFKVELSHLSRGIYYLAIRNKTSFTTLKLVKCS